MMMMMWPASLAWVRKNAARFVSTEVLRSSVGLCVSIITPMWFSGWLMLYRQMLLQSPSKGMPVQAHFAAGAQLSAQKCT